MLGNIAERILMYRYYLIGRLFVVICALCLLPAVFLSPWAFCQDMKHVLVLHAYHKGLTWTDSEENGIRSVLRTRVADVEVHTEYLDAKTISDDEHYRRFFELLKHKYASIVFKVVIVSDDDAYDFYLKHHETLFPGVPVVFCGVNYFEDSQREGREDLVTGVVEAFDIPSTLRTVLRLHPHTSRVIVINDRTTTGLANKKIITEEVVPKFHNKVTFVYFEDLTMAELLERVTSLSPGDIILLMTFNKDRSGAVFNYDQSIANIAREAKVPIYGVWDFYLGKGIVGGMLTSGVDQGRMAGEMALRVLDGEKVRTIPVVKVSPNRYEFDYQQMNRFGIRTSDLPPGSMVVNEPVSFYNLHKRLVWATISGFLGLTMIIVLLLVNIRQRRQGVEALRESEVRYRTLVNNVNIGVYRNTGEPHGRFIQVNPAMARIFGYDSIEEFLGIPVSDLYQDSENRIDILEEIQRNGLVKEKVLALKKRNGTPIWCSVTATAQYDEDGTIKWMDSVLEDITERKRAEETLQRAHDELEQKVTERTKALLEANLNMGHEIQVRQQAEGALQEREKQLRQIIDLVPHMIFVKDWDGKYLLVNQAVAEGYNTSVSALTGKYHSDLHPDESQLRHMLEDDREVMTKGKPKFIPEEPYTDAQGTLHFLQTTKVPFHTIDNNTNAVLGVAIDITERKQAEDERLRLERELQQAKKAESLGRMAGAIAHNFNNLLMEIMGNLELVLCDLPQEQEARRNIMDSMTASRRAAEISRFMLTSIGQTAARMESLDLSEATRETITLLSTSLPEKAHIRTDFPSEGPIIRADGSHIKQILTNLVLNAGEAIGEKEGDITLAIRVMSTTEIRGSKFFPADWEPKENSYVCLSVSDTGCGLDADTQEKVFDHFFSTKFTGRGLGLPVVLGLVRAHEGAITVESRLSRGATFRVFFPLSTRKVLSTKKEEAPVSCLAEERRLILVVDDEPAMLGMVQSILKRLGHEAVVAGGGFEAVEIFRARKEDFSLVLLDLGMPGMNGWQTLAALRALQPNIPAILASGYDEAQVMQGDHREKPQAFLHKPYQIADLKAALGATCKMSQRGINLPEGKRHISCV